MRAILLAGLLCASCAGMPGAPLSYSALPFSATVVDAETKRPLEGVVVVAVWELDYREGVISPYHINVTEAVTDAKGRFSMPGWGPLDVPPGERGHLLRMAANQPTVYFFKPGYQPGYQVSGGEPLHLEDPLWVGPTVQRPGLDGATLTLSPSRALPREYALRLSVWRNGLPIGGCGWATVPKMTVALLQENRRIRQRTGDPDALRLAELPETFRGKYCGAIQALLRETSP